MVNVMGMEFGVLVKKIMIPIKDSICRIIKMDMGFINGPMVLYIRGLLKMI
jgi:hypothetical protein